MIIPIVFPMIFLIFHGFPMPWYAHAWACPNICLGMPRHVPWPSHTHTPRLAKTAACQGMCLGMPGRMPRHAKAYPRQESHWKITGNHRKFIGQFCFFSPPVIVLAQGSLLVGLPKGNLRGPVVSPPRRRRIFCGPLCNIRPHPGSGLQPSHRLAQGS